MSVAGELISLSPLELKFNVTDKINQQKLRLHNNSTTDAVGFKVKTTAPKRYCVRPNSGYIPPDQTVEVTILLNVSKERGSSSGDKDKFQVQSLLLPGTQDLTETDLRDLFTNADPEKVRKQRLSATVIGESPSAPSTPGDVLSTPIRQVDLQQPVAPMSTISHQQLSQQSQQTQSQPQPQQQLQTQQTLQPQAPYSSVSRPTTSTSTSMNNGNLEDERTRQLPIQRERDELKKEVLVLKQQLQQMQQLQQQQNQSGLRQRKSPFESQTSAGTSSLSSSTNSSSISSSNSSSNSATKQLRGNQNEWIIRIVLCLIVALISYFVFRR